MHFLLFSSERRLLILSSTAVNQLVTRGAWTKTRRVEVPSPLLLLLNQNKANARKGKNVVVEKRGGNKEGRVASSTKTRQARSHGRGQYVPIKNIALRNLFFSAYHLFFAKTEMQVEHLRCPVIKDFIPPFSP